MPVNLIVNEEGRAIRNSENNVVQQNYVFGKGLIGLNSIKVKVNFGEDIDTVTMCFIMYVASSSSSPTEPNNVFELRNSADLKLSQFVNGTVGSSSNNPRTSCLRLYNGSSYSYAWNLNGATNAYRYSGYNSVGQTRMEYLTVSPDLIQGNINTGLDWESPVENLSFDTTHVVPRSLVFQPSGNDYPHTRLLIYKKKLAEYELRRIFGGGNSGDTPDPLNCIGDFNFRKAEIIDFLGGDKVSFRDESLALNHAEIIAGLPVGTMEEQRDYVNANNLLTWTY